MSALIFQVDVFSGAGQLPENLQQAQEGAKDIQYASKTRFNTDRIKQFEAMRGALCRVLDNAAKNTFAKTKSDGAQVERSMDALVAELNSIAAAITPARAVTQPGK